MTPIVRSGALLLAAFLTHHAVAEEAESFQAEMAVGKRYHLTVVTDQSSRMKLGAQDMTQKSSVEVGTSQTISSGPSKDTRKITVKYERMAMNMEVAGQKMSYDSAKPDASAENPLAATFSKIVGKQMVAVVDANYKVKSVEKDAAVEAAFAQDPVVSGMLNKDGLEQMLRQRGIGTAPPKPAKVGDSWPFVIEQALPGVGALKVTGTYTYARNVEKDGSPCAELKIGDGKITMKLAAAGSDPNSPEARMAAAGMKLTEGRIAGTIHFDRAVHTVRESDVSMNLTMAMKNPADPTAEISIPTEQHIVTKLTKVEDVK